MLKLYNLVDSAPPGPKMKRGHKPLFQSSPLKLLFQKNLSKGLFIFSFLFLPRAVSETS